MVTGIHAKVKDARRSEGHDHQAGFLAEKTIKELDGQTDDALDGQSRGPKVSGTAAKRLRSTSDSTGPYSTQAWETYLMEL